MTKSKGRFLAVTLINFATASAVPAASFTTLATFNMANGANPYAGLTLSGSTLYGTTVNGGANGNGTVFSIPLAGDALTTLATFDYINGATPYAGLTVLGDTLYGTTATGGAHGLGTVFSVSISGGTPATLVSFDGTNGANPQAALTLSGNTLYGTTVNGGTEGYGTVFSVIVRFPGDANGDHQVNFDDLVIVAQHYNQTLGQSYATGDFNGDGVVNFDDLVVLAQHYNQTELGFVTTAISTEFAADWSLAQSLVPEPTCVTAILLTGIPALVYRVRRVPLSTDS